MEDYILKKCPWFYDFDGVHHDCPDFIPPIIIESGQPPRRYGQAVKETDLGGFGNKYDEEDDVDEGRIEDSEQDQLEDAIFIHENENENVSDTETEEQASAKPIKQSAKAQTKATTSEARSKSKRSLPEDFDSQSTKKSRRGRWNSTKRRLTIAKSLYEQAKMNDSRERDQARADREERRQRFELERQQRDHQHAAEMARSEILIKEGKERIYEGKKRILRLQLELQRLQQQRGPGAYDTSNVTTKRLYVRPRSPFESLAQTTEQQRHSQHPSQK